MSHYEKHETNTPISCYILQQIYSFYGIATQSPYSFLCILSILAGSSGNKIAKKGLSLQPVIKISHKCASQNYKLVKKLTSSK